MSMIMIGFITTMLIFVMIGVASSRASRAEVSDYLVAGRSVSPWVAGLSAVASNNSGFMFIGAIGFTYSYGLFAFWLFFAWLLGDYCSWLLVHRRLRARSERQGNDSVTGFLAHDGATEDRALLRRLRRGVLNDLDGYDLHLQRHLEREFSFFLLRFDYRLY